MRAVGFDASGTLLATLGRDGSLRIWNAHTGVEVAALSGDSHPITVFASAPSEGMLAVGYRDGQLRLLDRANWQPRFSIAVSTNALCCLAYHPGGHKLAVAAADGRVSICEARADQVLTNLVADVGAIARMTFTPDGRGLVVHGSTQTTVYDLASGRKLSDPGGTAAPRGRVVVDPQGERFVSIDSAGGVELHGVGVAPVVLEAIRGSQPDFVRRVFFSRDGQWFCTGGEEGTAIAYQASDGQRWYRIPNRISQAEFSPDARLLATLGAEHLVRIWDLRSRRELRIWDASSGRERLRIEAPFHYVCRAVFSPDGNRIATSSGSDRTARIWDARTGVPLLTLRKHSRIVLGLNYSPDGRRLATASYDGTVKLWDAVTGRELGSLDHGTNHVSGASFSPDGNRLVSASEVGIRIWDIGTARVLASIDCPRPGGEGHAQWDRSGERIFAWGWDNAVRVLDGRTAREQRRFPTRGIFTFGGALHPDGDQLIVDTGNAFFGGYGSEQPRAELLDVRTGRRWLRLQGHREIFNQFAFAKDGRRLMSASFDFTVRQWETFPWNAADYPGSEGEPLRTRIRRYADGYWRERLAAEQARQLGAVSTQERAVSVPDRSLWPGRSSAATSNQLDLTDHYTSILSAWFYPHFSWEWADDDLAGLPVGLIVLGGVTFDVRGVIQLRRAEPSGGVWQKRWERPPGRVEGIPVGRAFHRLHALLATDEKEAEGRTVGRLAWRHVDGERVEFPIVYGEHVRCWWEWPNDPSGIKRGRVAWRGSNPAAARENATLRLYVSTWENPRPDVEVQTLDLVSELAEAAPFVIAITVE